jgi:hypothetical protein
MSDFTQLPSGLFVPVQKPPPPPATPPPPPTDNADDEKPIQYVARRAYGLATPVEVPPTDAEGLSATQMENARRTGMRPPDDTNFVAPICPTCKTPAIGHYGIETTCIGGMKCIDCGGVRDVNRISAVWICKNNHTFAAQTGYFCEDCGKPTHWAERATKGVERELRGRQENYIPFVNPQAAWVVGKFFSKNAICGCGQPREYIDWLTKVLRAIADSFDDKKTQPDYYDQPKQKLTKADHEGLYWLAWYWLDATGLIEHGGVVCNGWLTPKGEEMLAALELLGVDGAEEAIQ